MKRTVFLLIIGISWFAGCKTNRKVADMASVKPPNAEINTVDDHRSVNYSDQATWLLGYFNLSQLKQEPHSVWFYKGYDGYQPDPEAIKNLERIDIEGISIKIVMGTWCPDSRREVPRFMKLLDTWKFPPSKVSFIGVDNGKLSPVGEYDQLDIQRVPTFIVYKNNIEEGRIIENPATSLEQDMVGILRGMNNNK
jgi:hypothetical protein